MLPFQGAMSETSHKQQNLIFTNFISVKLSIIPYVALKWDLKFDYERETFPFFIANRRFLLFWL